jgi:Cys-rich repeat protein
MWKMAPLAVFLALFVLLLGHCAPAPRYVTCDNDAMCREADSNFHYCSDSHCVECVSNSQCSSGQTCRAGQCD